MERVNYIVKKADIGNTSLEEKDAILVGPFSINNTFDSSKDFIDLHIYSNEGKLLKSQLNYKSSTQSTLSAGAGKSGASNLIIEPYKDAIANGFSNGDIRVHYNFFTDLLHLRKTPPRFFVEKISGDRTEIQLLTLELTDDEIIQSVSEVRAKLENQSYFSEFKVSFGKNEISTGINIDVVEYKDGQSVIVKLLNPLPAKFTKKDICNLLEIVADSSAFDIELQEVQEEIKVPYIKGPNFDATLDKEVSNPTEFFNFDELFSYPVTGSYYQLYSLFNEKGAQISIDHSDYGDFIHFSSAEERLRNFKYKLDLIDNYEVNRSAVTSTNYTKLGASGSKDYYDGLIKGIVDNFDHYDRYLYYESGSYSWPKTNSQPPYINQTSATVESQNWFATQLVSASNFDLTNYDVLTNSIPSYLKEDKTNEPLIMFVHMLAQHFDNLWIYFKAVSNKYDADNRLDFGISKDLVRSAIESFGINVYNSNKNLENLFASFNGENYTSGNTKEVINHFMQITSGSGLEHLQPMPADNYQKEIYKRIYHNIPLLTKAKGTHRGLRALINCFGIPDNLLTIKQFGGTAIDGNRHFSTQQGVTSSLDKIRLDNSGSLVSGSTLSLYTSVVDRVYKYSDDQHTVEVGFDISDTTNDLIQARVSGSFDYDNYIGDPRDAHSTNYHVLEELAEKIFTDEQEGSIYNYWNGVQKLWQNADWDWNATPFEAFRQTGDFIRLIKFFDNSIFRTIKDFIPARSNVNTGVIIKPHILNRSKAKQVQVSYENKLHTGSITINPITGSHGGTWDMTPIAPYTTNYSASIISPLGFVPRHVQDESPKYTGEFSGSLLIASDGELNAGNPFKSQAQPIAQFSLRAFNFSLPIPLACDVILNITKVGEFYRFSPVGPGLVGITYPTTVPNSNLTISSSIDYDLYQFLTATATPTYPYYFEGWYDGNNVLSDTLIQTSSVLTIYEDTNTTIDHYFAHFSTEAANRVVYTFTTNYPDGTADGTMRVGTYGLFDSVKLNYPETIAATGSYQYTQNWNLYSSMAAEAVDGYNTYPFLGWYNSSNNLLTTSSMITITSGSFGNTTAFYARYTPAKHYFTFRNWFRVTHDGQKVTDDGTYQLFQKRDAAQQITQTADHVVNSYFLAEEYRATNNYYKAVYYIDVEIDGTLGTGYTYTFTFPDNTNPDYDRAVNFYTNILDTYLYERNLDGYHHSTNITGTLPASI